MTIPSTDLSQDELSTHGEDPEFLALCNAELKELQQQAGKSLTLAEVRNILADVSGSLADDIVAERAGRLENPRRETLNDGD